MAGSDCGDVPDRPPGERTIATIDLTLGQALFELVLDPSQDRWDHVLHLGSLYEDFGPQAPLKLREQVQDVLALTRRRALWQLTDAELLAMTRAAQALFQNRAHKERTRKRTHLTLVQPSDSSLSDPP